MKMNIFKLLTGFVVLIGSNAAMAIPYCNAFEPTCIISVGFDNGYGSTCLERKNNTYCNNDNGFDYFLRANCDMNYVDDTCATLMIDSEESASNIEDATGCSSGSGAGYCGWRDGVNKTGANAVSNSSRAKLHACSHSGNSDESYYDTLSECTSNPIGQTAHAKNVACTDSTWDTLCDGWL